MKRLYFLVLLASVMLTVMTIASCKNSNKPAADASAQDSIPEVLKDVAGIEKFQTKLDYGFFFNNLKQNIADRIKAFMKK